MDEADVRKLLEDGRGAGVDWLPGRAPVEDLAATLVAMANSGGGTLLLGVAPRTDKIAGVDDVAGTTERVLRATLSATPPLIIPLPETVQVGDLQVMVVNVPRASPTSTLTRDAFWAVRERPICRSMPTPCAGC